MEPDRVHANKCALVVMCLREYFPLDVIGLIASIYWDFRSMPVYAFLTDRAYINHRDHGIISQNVFKICPQLKVRYMKFLSIHERITDRGSLELNNIGLLIPGFVWD